MSRLSARAAWGVLMVLLGSCDLEKTRRQLSADTVMVGMLLSTPAVEIPIDALFGFDAGFFLDAGLPAFDGGIPGFDGGLPSFDGGIPFPGLDGGLPFSADWPLSFNGSALVVAPQAVATVFVGRLEGSGLNLEPRPLEQAQVTVGPAAGPSVPLAALGQGLYLRTSIEDPRLAYQPSVRWVFRAQADGQDYTGEVARTPEQERARSLHPDGGVLEHARGVELTFSRPDPRADDERALGFVTVFPLSAQGAQLSPTYTTVPRTPLELLRLVAYPQERRRTRVTIPGSAFPEAPRTYLVLFQTVSAGGPESDNLFRGSALLVGPADLALVRVR